MKTVFTLFVLAVLAASLRAQDPASKPKSAEIVDIPADRDFKAGNIKVVFSDGHSEVVTKNGYCMDPHVSANGNLGWTQCSGFDRKGYALNETLVVRLLDGRTKEFRPSVTAPFIEDWRFVDNDSAIVMKSRGHHGPASFIRYDVASGKMTQKKDGRSDSEKAPSWAHPLSND